MVFKLNKIVTYGEKIKFFCTRCGRCCCSGPNVALTAHDICKIAKYLNTNWRDLAGKYFYVVIADQIPVAVLRGIGGKCVFLKFHGKLATCVIYPVRPARCRLYPFIPISPGESKKLEVSSKCPGVEIGDVIDPPWEELGVYIKEVREHYTTLFEYIFVKNNEPLRALEDLLDHMCSRTT